MVQLKHIHFATYALVFTIYGCAVTAVGPIIIYFSKVTGEDETYFSFIFLARAAGYIVGGSAIKYLTAHFSYHRLFGFLIIVCGSALVLSSYNFGFLNLTITMLVAGASCCMMNILSNLCVFELFIGEGQDFWIQLLNLFFGIGGLIGPAIVIYYEELAMRALGILTFIALIPFAFLHSPQGHQSSQQQAHKKKQLLLPRTAEICICLLFFLYIAEEVGYAGWIPTYAFKAGVANEEQASALASIFWIVNTIARLILLYLQGSVADRLASLLRYLVASTFIVVVIQWMGNLALVSYAGVISSGFFLSAMYALFFSIAQEYGYGLSTSNTANFAMCASLGQGFLVMPIGYAMGYFGYRSLIYIIFIFSAAMLVIFTYVNRLMASDSKEQKDGLETPLADMNTF